MREVKKDLSRNTEQDPSELSANEATPTELPTNTTRAQKIQAELAPKKTAPLTPEKRLNSGERVLLAADKDNYTLQLMGSHNINRITNFIAQQKNPERFYYFSSNHMGKRWYVVVYNSFRSKQQAQLGISELPPNLQDQKPWVRSIAGIQLDIKKYYDIQ